MAGVEFLGSVSDGRSAEQERSAHSVVAACGRDGAPPAVWAVGLACARVWELEEQMVSHMD